MMNNGQSPGLDPGYGSLEFSTFADFTQDLKAKTSREDLLPEFSKTRTTSPSISQLDLAVANALQNLQTLQVEKEKLFLKSFFLTLQNFRSNVPTC